MPTDTLLNSLTQQGLRALISLLTRMEENMDRVGCDVHDYKVWFNEKDVDIQPDKLPNANRENGLPFNSTMEQPDLDLENYFVRFKSDGAFAAIGWLHEYSSNLYQKLSDHVAKAHERRISLSRHFGIRQLPNEVLQMIFHFADDPVLISHVCRKFRFLALENSRLWLHIPTTPRKLTELFLLRSAKLPLDIDIEWERDLGYNFSLQFLAALLPHRARWRSLNLIQGRRESCYFLTQNLVTDQSTDSKFPLENLRSAHVNSYGIDLLPIFSSEMKELGIYRFSSDDWGLRRQLTRFSSLQDLTLRMYPATTTETGEPSSTLQFSSLRTFSLAAARTLLQHWWYTFDTPNLASLTISLLRWDGAVQTYEKFILESSFWSKLSTLKNLTHFTLHAAQLADFSFTAVVLQILSNCKSLTYLSVTCFSECAPPDTSLPDYSSLVMWEMRHPLKTLRLINYYNHLEDVKRIGKGLRHGSIWDNFESLILVALPVMQSHYYGRKKQEEFDAFLHQLTADLEGRVTSEVLK